MAGADAEAANPTKIAAMAALGLLVVGSAYNVGFFLRLGVHWFVYLSYKDHLTTIVFLLSPLAISLFAVFVIKSLIYGEARIVPKFDYTMLAIIFTSVLMLSAILGSEEASSRMKAIADWLLYVVVFVACGFLLLKIVESFALAADGRPDYSSMIAYAAGLLLFIGWLGYFLCAFELKSTRFNSEIMLDQDKRIENVRFVRIMEDGFFFVAQGDPGRVQYRRSDSVQSLATRKDG